MYQGPWAVDLTYASHAPRWQWCSGAAPAFVRTLHKERYVSIITSILCWTVPSPGLAIGRIDVRHEGVPRTRPCRSHARTLGY